MENPKPQDEAKREATLPALTGYAALVQQLAGKVFNQTGPNYITSLELGIDLVTLSMTETLSGKRRNITRKLAWASIHFSALDEIEKTIEEMCRELAA